MNDAKTDQAFVGNSFLNLSSCAILFSQNEQKEKQENIHEYREHTCTYGDKIIEDEDVRNVYLVPLSLMISDKVFFLLEFRISFIRFPAHIFSLRCSSVPY